MSHLESISEGMSMLSERQKLFLVADKSAFGWKTVTEYLQHELTGKKGKEAKSRTVRKFVTLRKEPRKL